MNEFEPDSFLEQEYENRTHLPDEDTQEYSGYGSGEDDLADYNQNEADDYRNE